MLAIPFATGVVPRGELGIRLETIGDIGVAYVESVKGACEL